MIFDDDHRGYGRCLILEFRGASLGYGHANTGSTMFAPTVTMDKIPTLKIGR